jgi:redox-sensing transcriptional repressor
VADPKKISDSTVRRLSHYLRLLSAVQAEGVATVSSEELARWGGTTAAQVRKDLSVFGSFGKRGMGYDVVQLAGELRGILGLDREWGVALIGAGRLGLALLSYPSFRERGFHIRAVFDTDPAKIDSVREGVRVRRLDDLERVIAAGGIDIAVLAVPAAEAQAILQRLAGAGVRAVLNFAPVTLEPPPGVQVRHVDMALELEGLSFSLVQGRLGGDDSRPVSSAR